MQSMSVEQRFHKTFILQMTNKIVNRIVATLMLAGSILPVMGQDMIARQAPVDIKMRAVDSVEIQRLFHQENLENPAGDLYPNWENKFVNAYGNIKLPEEYKIDLRNFCMPINNRIVTSKYGYRRRFRRQHQGLDIDANLGDTIRAAFDGKVRMATFQRRGYGNLVVLRHPNGLETVYGHMTRLLVKELQNVKAGDAIGLAGNTGRSYGVHLHFETRFLGEYIDPAKLFDFANQDVTGDYYIFRGRGRGTLLGKHDASGKTEGTDVAQGGEEEVTYASAANSKSRSSRTQSGNHIHKVRRGETLSSIAHKYGTTVTKLCRDNGISTKTKLQVGQILKYS